MRNETGYYPNQGRKISLMAGKIIGFRDFELEEDVPLTVFALRNEVFSNGVIHVIDTALIPR